MEEQRHKTDEVTPEEEDSERVLDNLEDELQSVYEELDRITEKEHQYEILGRACAALEELESVGAQELFWGKLSDRPGEHLRHAQRNISAYTEELQKVEEHRQAIIDRIGDQNDVLDRLDCDLRNAMEREESRRAEWVVEREAEAPTFHALVMPWARGFEEDQRSRRSLLATVTVALLLGLLVQLVEVPIPERAELIEVPERVAKLIREVRTPPPPPTPVEEVVEPEPEPDEPLVAEEEPPEETVEVEQVVAEVPQEDTREKVKSKGILAFRDSFASRAMNRPIAPLGSQARVSAAGQDAVGRPERSMVTTSAPGTSGGINLADISRQVGGGGGQAIEGVELTRVASSIGGGEGPDRPLSGGVSAGRTDEEIQIVFDRYKAALYRLYNRELRKDPTLRGQLVLKLTIEPDGSVSFCTLQSSDMDAPTLAQQVVSRVLNFDFGAKEDIVAMTIIYPIDFLPAA